MEPHQLKTIDGRSALVDSLVALSKSRKDFDIRLRQVVPGIREDEGLIAWSQVHQALKKNWPDLWPNTYARRANGRRRVRRASSLPARTPRDRSRDPPLNAGARASSQNVRPQALDAQPDNSGLTRVVHLLGSLEAHVPAEPPPNARAQASSQNASRLTRVAHGPAWIVVDRIDLAYYNEPNMVFVPGIPAYI